MGGVEVSDFDVLMGIVRGRFGWGGEGWRWEDTKTV